ncbi:prohead protease/major capsid protein fusion protein [Synergistes jonesii]|uniref:Prohead serine protease domain-containing protein n=1 Tax=Synergistes jonesii TaxID=2754 RepID=A0A073IUD9_9BACT|nr:prohead protease/major capsid protein fusion protein [Synergistes jonesii]KEJ93205.1 hypothetical protein EH55_12955 [Synergistes jonesii]
MKKKMGTNKPCITREEFFRPEYEHRRETGIISAPDDESRSVELSFSSDSPIRRRDWWNEEWYDEILDHSAGAVNITRLAEIGVGLYNHDAKMPIGRLENVSIGDDHKGHCRLVFDDDEQSDAIFRKVKSGTLKGVSVGYRVYEWEKVRSGEKSKDGITGPAVIARQWEPYEISIVSCPADPTVGVGRALDIKDERGVSKLSFREMVMAAFRELHERKIERAVFEKKIREILAGLEPEESEEALRYVGDMRAAAGLSEQEPTPAPQSNVNEGARAIEAERARAADISALCAKYGISPEQTQRYIAEGNSVDAVGRAILESQRREAPGLNVGPTVTVGAEERQKFRAAVVDGLRMRLGHTIAAPVEGAESFRGIRLLDLAREVCSRSGERVSYADDGKEIAKRAFSTSDFPAIMSDLANVTLMSAYTEADATWRSWCQIGSASDFKAQHQIRIGEMPMLEPVLEGGEYKMADLSETKDSFAIGTYGKKFALTRQAIINDDLDAFARIPQLFGAASARTINAAVYALLTANAAIAEDNKALFHADHGNLAASGSALSIESLSAARVAMRRQGGLRKGRDKVALNIAPAYLIIPPELETLARQLIYSDTDISAQNPAVINPFKGALTPIIDACLSGGAWYLAAGKNSVDTIKVAFLNGVNSPTLESRLGWEIDGLEYKVRLDFGVWNYEYRGLYKNAGI